MSTAAGTIFSGGDAGDACGAPGDLYNFPPGKRLYVLGTFQENRLGEVKGLGFLA